MAKWFGEIGYLVTTETSPGVWEEQIIKRNYYGEIRKNTRRFETSDKVNDDINISNVISIVADPFAYDNYHNMRYVTFRGVKWKVTNIEEAFPRLTLTVGGVYNE